MLVALIVYSLPNILLGCVGGFLAQNMGGGLIGSTLVLALSCCLFPLLLVYSIITMPMLALGIGRYVEDPRIDIFFEFAFLFETLRKHTDHCDLVVAGGARRRPGFCDPRRHPGDRLGGGRWRCWCRPTPC